MIRIAIITSLFYFLSSCSGNSSPNTPQMIQGSIDLRSINFETQGIIPLDGPWEFYWNQLLSPEKYETRLTNSTISPNFLNVPGQWQKSDFPAHGYASYRLTLILPESGPELSISMKDAGTSYSMFVDGKLASLNGKVGTSKEDSSPYYKYLSSRISPLFNENFFLEKDKTKFRKVEILIHVSNFYYSHSGLWNSIKLGTTKSIFEADRYKLNLDLIVFSSLMIMGLYHLGLFLNRRRDKSPFYFGIFCLLVSLRTVSINERMILDAFEFLSFEIVHKFEYLAFYSGIIVFILFVKSLYSEEFSTKWIYISTVIMLPCITLVILTPMAIYNETLVPAQIFTLLSIIYTIFSLVLAVLHKRLGAKLFLFGWLAFALSIINDILKNLGLVHTPTLTSYGLLTFIIFQASILSRKFAAAFNEIESLAETLKKFSEELEDKVTERTKELKETLEKVQELKTQQDGDYFLTSLLLKPLNMNKAESRKVTIEFLSSQKKKFEFKDWKEEIGGDLCMSNSIILNGRKYSVFINADAMGKSLQGAGGALVLGSVFESIIIRNQNDMTAQSIFPESWIKESFLEMHRVFETFDGSMLVSLVLGLVDELNGFFYMINAEHPWTILYRDGKATFLNTESGYRKLGTLGVKNKIRIFTYQLHPGDVLISGSDGRDDILLAPNEFQESYINEDETLILKHVEKSRADLNEIYEEILKTGILIDDLTMIKVSVNDLEIETDLAKSQDIILQDKKSFTSRKEHFRELLLTKNYSLASQQGVSLLGEITEETELLFQISYTLKKTGNYELALKLGERVKLREPHHVRNLINLSDIYFFSGNDVKSEYLIDLVLKIDEDNQYARKRKGRVNLKK